jgi:hypothetical protein
VVIAAPVAEETLFRGYAFGHLRQRSSFLSAAFVSLLLFVAAHLYLFAGNPFIIGLAATLAAVAAAFPMAYLFEHGTLRSVPTDFAKPARLYRALNNGLAEEVATGERVLKTENGITYPTWQFNDVDVALARDPGNRYYLRVSVDDVATFANTWAHGKDGRTIFPAKDVPSGVLP